MVAPWTQTLSAQWRPTLAFYEERIQILRFLEQEAGLSQFAVDEDKIGARLAGTGAQINLSHTDVTLTTLAPDSDLATLRPIVDEILGMIEVTSAWGWSARFQHIAELEATFEDAVAFGSDHVAPGTSNNLFVTDWAVLLDLRESDGATGKAEYGIIRASEARERLSGFVGRIGRRDGEPGQLSNLDPPDVGLFLDCLWEQLGDMGPVSSVWEQWASACERSVGLAESLKTTLQNFGYKESK